MKRIDLVKFSKFTDILSGLSIFNKEIYGGDSEKTVFVRRISRLIEFKPMKIILKKESSGHIDGFGYCDIAKGEYRKVMFISPSDISFNRGSSHNIKLAFWDLTTSSISEGLKCIYSEDIVDLEYELLNENDKFIITNLFKI